MSSPIAISRSKASSASSSSSSSSLSSAPTTPTSAGLYVPVHKRTGSSSSRASSPSSARFPFTAPEAPKQHPRIYSVDFLLSLRPYADESAKEKMRTTCPEVVMNRRTRKNLEFAEHQQAAAMRKAALQQQPISPAPTAAPAPARVMPRRTRPAGRAPERRRQALQSTLKMNDSWRDSRVPVPAPLAVV